MISPDFPGFPEFNLIVSPYIMLLNKPSVSDTANVGVMLGQRQKRWLNVMPPLLSPTHTLSTGTHIFFLSNRHNASIIISYTRSVTS